jgi:hypothetical protein
MPWWQGPSYHCDRDPVITVTGTHLSLWQGPSYHLTGTHLSLWQGPSYHCDRDPLITVTGTQLSLWQGPTYHCDRDPLITGSIKDECKYHSLPKSVFLPPDGYVKGRFLGAFAKLRNATLSFMSVCMSVRPPVRVEQFGCHWTNFHENFICVLVESLSRK